MTDEQHILLLWASIAAPLVGGVAAYALHAPRAARAVGLCVAAVVLAAGVASVADPVRGSTWLIGDFAAGLYLCVVAVVGAMSVLVSQAYLSRTPGTFFSVERSARLYWIAIFWFWAALVCIPLVANLGIAWLVVEASTAASAVLVAHSGKARALEAGWKYLVLTSLGLSAAFLGIVLIFLAAGQDGGLHALDWSRLDQTISAMPSIAATVAYALLMLGLAAKIGWAPIHNWLPDAHSEAPAPVSAMLSAALLPTVILLVWRLRDASASSLGSTTANAPLVAFGLLSVAIAIPFLWQPLAWKRFLAYSSMEHMGIIAVGIAFGGPIALTGVVIHVAGHALAKSLGFYAAIPLHDLDHQAVHHRATGIADVAPGTASAMMVSAVTLAGLPPGPLFISEVLIVFGGIETGHTAVAVVLAVLIGLAFFGVLDALLAIVQQRPTARARVVESSHEGLLHHSLQVGRAIARVTPSADVVASAGRTGTIVASSAAIGATLLALGVCGWLLAASDLMLDMARGIA